MNRRIFLALILISCGSASDESTDTEVEKVVEITQ
jgi:hypothetical protein